MRLLFVIVAARFDVSNIALEWIGKTSTFWFKIYFKDNSNLGQKFFWMFSFAAVDELSLSLFLHLDFHFVLKVNMVISQFFFEKRCTYVLSESF